MMLRVGNRVASSSCRWRQFFPMHTDRTALFPLKQSRMNVHIQSSSLHTKPALRHDHSKGIIGRDDGSDERKADWWEERGPVDENAPDVEFVFVLGGSSVREITVVGKVGETVEDVGKREGYMEGACDGNCQCSTCHVFIMDPADQARLGMPDKIEDFELDMVELAREYNKFPEASRLSCQIELTPALKGLRVKLPASTTNYMDDIPF
eukprot:m.257594 g.257594  ORF g.257594 m.257594 type:complete len:208 (-) comp35462_c0_seq1:277-900(-)